MMSIGWVDVIQREIDVRVQSTKRRMACEFYFKSNWQNWIREQGWDYTSEDEDWYDATFGSEITA